MISLGGEQTDPAGLEYLVSQGAEGVAGAHLENILMKIFERNMMYVLCTTRVRMYVKPSRGITITRARADL